ncbi:hypothetical protein J132_09823 [Termitomyces sp. J132]|nr:hypothetical protein J132_09823 [Termitomyces sp. J132]
MFLWAYFMCEEIKRQGDAQALHRLLDHLPKGLDALYCQICQTIIEKDNGVGFSLSVLQWIVNSPRPLQFSELQEGLRLMRPQINNVITRDAWFDQSSDLLWSRQDIVDACGNLVIYAGPSKGDTFTLVHLSANQFFQSSNQLLGTENIRSFVKDIQNAKETLGILCLQYLLRKTLCSAEYLMPSATFLPHEPSEEANFIEKYPLFNFAVIHWPEFVLNSLSSGCSNPSLINTIISFVSDHVVIAWLVHASHLLGIEVTIDTLEQLAGIDGSCGLTVMTDWASETTNMLTMYRQALATSPKFIWKCLPTKILPRTYQLVQGAIGTTDITPHILPMRHAWIHYNPKTDILLSIESHRMCLRGQLIKTGVATKQGLVPTNLGVPSSITCCAAAISHGGQYIAAMYDTGGISHHEDATTIHQMKRIALRPVFLVCWRLPSSFYMSSSHDGSQFHPILILFDRYNTLWLGICASSPNRSLVIGNGANMISFIGDDMLVTPRGIWDVNKREWLSGPSTIYHPMPEFNMVCFSGNGKCAARIKDSEIEFFNTQNGTSFYKAKFADTEHLLPLASSYSGNKIVVYKHISSISNVNTLGSQHWCSASSQLLCFVLDNHQSVIELDIPYPISVYGGSFTVNSWQFSTDEETLVASVDPCFHSSIKSRQMRSTIGVWNFSKDKNGQYVNPAPMKHLYKALDRLYAFCIVSRLHLLSRGDSEVFIADDSGVLTRRSITSMCSTDDEQAVDAQNPFNTSTTVQINQKEKLINLKTLSIAQYVSVHF